MSTFRVRDRHSVAREGRRRNARLAVHAAAGVPLLAFPLLRLNGRSGPHERDVRNGPLTVALLRAALALFAFPGAQEILSAG